MSTRNLDNSRECLDFAGMEEDLRGAERLETEGVSGIWVSGQLSLDEAGSSGTRGFEELLRRDAPDYLGYNPSDIQEDIGSDSSDTAEEENVTRTVRILREAPYTRVRGEPFRIIRKDGKVTLSHDRWSLVGTGDSLVEAEMALYESARKLAHVYLNRPLDEMSRDAIDMRDFIADIVSHA